MYHKWIGRAGVMLAVLLSTAGMVQTTASADTFRDRRCNSVAIGRAGITLEACIEANASTVHGFVHLLTNDQADPRVFLESLHAHLDGPVGSDPQECGRNCNDLFMVNRGPVEDYRTTGTEFYQFTEPDGTVDDLSKSVSVEATY